MIKILFICHGNICRSTMAEFVFRDMARTAGREGEFFIDSAATSREEIGNDIHPGTKRKLIAHHIPFTKHSARQMTKADYDKFDYIVGMDDANIRDIIRISGGDSADKVRRLLDFAGEHRNIADPWYTGNFDETWEDVTKGCRALLHTLLQNEKNE